MLNLHDNSIWEITYECFEYVSQQNKKTQYSHMVTCLLGTRVMHIPHVRYLFYVCYI